MIDGLELVVEDKNKGVTRPSLSHFLVAMCASPFGDIYAPPGFRLTGSLPFILVLFFQHLMSFNSPTIQNDIARVGLSL